MVAGVEETEAVAQEEGVTAGPDAAAEARAEVAMGALVEKVAGAAAHHKKHQPIPSRTHMSKWSHRKQGCRVKIRQMDRMQVASTHCAKTSSRRPAHKPTMH